jgi:hemolysin activation/secretion protein
MKPLKIFSLAASLLMVCYHIHGFSDEKSESSLYPVSKLIFKYIKDHPSQIPLTELNHLRVALLETADGYFSVSEKENIVAAYQQVNLSIEELNQSGRHYFSRPALGAIVEEARQFLEKQGVHWSYLFINSKQMTAQGNDLRSSSDDELVVDISVPTVDSLSIRASENSYLASKTYVQKQKSRIEENFPLTLPDPSTGFPGQYIDPQALNNYLYSLNRHPGKRVDLEIGPTGSPGGLTLDFVVTEDRPYHFYFSATNNNPKVIHRWQESFGFLHTQLTGHDDILKLNYSTDSFDSFYTAYASYEAPLGMSTNTRWSLSGNYNRFLSAEFGLSPNLFRGTQGIVDFEIIGTLYQKNKFFLEAYGLMEYRHIHNREHAINPSVLKNFLLPAIGLKAVELKLESKIIATLQLETTMSNIFWDVRKRLDALGRKNISGNWAFIQGNLYWSFYLEPIVYETVERMANELVILGQLQNAFNFRLIPELEGVLGGVSTVRGYPQSTVAGDNLYMTSVEYRLHIPQLLKPNPRSKRKLFKKEFRWAPAQPKGRADWDFILRAFYDLGKTTNNHRVKGERNYVVEGLGLGADLVLWSNLVLKYDWGVALKSANGIHHGNKESYFTAVLMY